MAKRTSKLGWAIAGLAAAALAYEFVLKPTAGAAGTMPIHVKPGAFPGLPTSATGMVSFLLPEGSHWQSGTTIHTSTRSVTTPQGLPLPSSLTGAWVVAVSPGISVGLSWVDASGVAQAGLFGFV
jgi:hypothetical protein